MLVWPVGTELTRPFASPPRAVRGQGVPGALRPGAAAHVLQGLREARAGEQQAGAHRGEDLRREGHVLLAAEEAGGAVPRHQEMRGREERGVWVGFGSEGGVFV